MPTDSDSPTAPDHGYVGCDGDVENGVRVGSAEAPDRGREHVAGQEAIVPEGGVRRI